MPIIKATQAQIGNCDNELIFSEKSKINPQTKNDGNRMNKESTNGE